MQAFNTGKAKACGVLAGSVGEVNPENPSVKAALDSGLLVDAKRYRARLLEAAGGDNALASALDENTALKAENTALKAENTALKARVAELEAKASAKAAAKAAKTEG